MLRGLDLSGLRLSGAARMDLSGADVSGAIVSAHPSFANCNRAEQGSNAWCLSGVAVGGQRGSWAPGC